MQHVEFFPDGEQKSRTYKQAPNFIGRAAIQQLFYVQSNCDDSSLTSKQTKHITFYFEKFVM